MDVKRFWELIATIGGYPPADEDKCFDRLEDALAAMGSDDILSFEDRLAEFLYELDRKSFADTPTVDTGRTQSSDSFLYNRCAVIVAGEEIYNEVLEGARSFQDFTHSHVPSSEPILYVAQKAYERTTGKPWQHNPFHDYETGSNEKWWH